MSTRGLIGYYKDGVTKAAYNHSDSYPDWLGNNVKEYISSKTIDEITGDFNKIELINEDTPPTPEQVSKLEKFSNLAVNTQKNDNWYNLLRDAQGDLNAYAEAGHMPDGKSFIKDSLFCEWAYIINLDRNVLEIYRGFQTKKPKKNRYALSKTELAVIKAEKLAKGKGHYVTNLSTGEKTYYRNHVYYNCDLIAQIPLEDVSAFDMDLFEKVVYASEDRMDGHVGEIFLPEDFAFGLSNLSNRNMVLAITGLCSA